MKHRILSYLLTGLVAYGVLGFSTMAFGGQWEEKAEIPRMGAISGGAWWLGAEAVNGKVYAFGGQDDLQPAGKLVHEYDPVRNVWTRLKKWERGRFRLGSALIRERSMPLEARRIIFRRSRSWTSTIPRPTHGLLKLICRPPE